MNRDTYVIVPVFNEEKVIANVINQLSQKFANIICVDDGSTDGSVGILRRLNVTLVKHKLNRGQGAAIQTGIERALKDPRARYFITFDADGQHNVLDAERLARHIRFHGVDVVLGSRFLGEARNMPILRRLCLKLAVGFTNLTTGLALTDTHNGLRVFNRNFAEKLRLSCSRMAHASEIIFRIAEHGFSYAECPVVIEYTDYSKGKGQSIMNSFNIMRELMKQRAKAWRVDS